MSVFGIVLFNPEIPPNTGNVMRLCANTRCSLRIIKPMGFEINEKSLRRAGMDYIQNVDTKIFENIDDFIISNEYKRYFLVTKYGKISYEKLDYQKGDCFIFGSESQGLSHEIFKKFKKSEKIYIPMAGKSRSLNLSNSVAICVYEALKQNEFQDL